MHWWKRFTNMVGMTDYVTDHFRMSEFDCRDGTPYNPLWVEEHLLRLCLNLEVIRECFSDNKITIVSGYRTKSHNKAVGGAKDSQHLLGEAADFEIEGFGARGAAKEVKALMKGGLITPGGIGSYPGWTHLDIRGKYVAWRK